MKKLLAIFLTSALIFCCVPFGVFSISASAATSGTTGDCEWVLEGTVLTISGEGKMGNYSLWGPKIPWGTSITEVIIEEGVTNIGDYAFSDCALLKSVSIPTSVTDIRDFAFQNCDLLENVDIPDGVTSIGNYAFNSCDLLTSVSSGQNITSIGEYAFADCVLLSGINIPNSVTSIGSAAFNNCQALTSVNIPNGINRIEKHLFNGCTSLESLIIPESVESIGAFAFYNCTSLININLPDSITSIEEDAFYNSAYYRKSSNWEDGVLYLDNHLIKADYPITSHDVKEGTLTIAEKGFYNCSVLESITIPNSVRNIGNDAFKNSAYFKDTSNWENGVLYIDRHLIKTDYDLSGDYVVKDGTLTIADNAFYDRSLLTSVTLPQGLVSIGKGAFFWAAITSITIPKSVEAIGSSAFESCEFLTDVYYGGSEADRENIVIDSSNDFLLNVNWHYKQSDEGAITGDVNGDGVLNVSDLAELKKYIAGLLDADTMASCNADIDGDETVNVGDLAELKKMIAGLV